MKFIALSLALVLSTAAADSNVEGYVHRGEAITVTIEVWAHEPQPPHKGEHIRLPLKIERDQRFASAAHFLIRAGYARAEEDAKKKNFRLPDIRIMGSTAVARGDKLKIVAHSDHRFEWPKDFQLQNGDVIRVMEFFF